MGASGDEAGIYTVKACEHNSEAALEFIQQVMWRRRGARVEAFL